VLLCLYFGYPGNTKLIYSPYWTSSQRKWYNFTICKSRVNVPLRSLISDRNDGWKTFLLDFSSSVEYVTGQAVDFKISSQDHDTVIEEELESLRSKVDELTNEVGPSLFLTRAWY